MKKTFRLENLDCAACAAKMEEAVRKLPGVTDACIAFMTARLTIEAGDERFGEVMQRAAKAIRRIEPACRIAD